MMVSVYRAIGVGSPAVSKKVAVFEDECPSSLDGPVQGLGLETNSEDSSQEGQGRVTCETII